MTDIHDVIESLEFVFEGRLDTYAGVRRFTVVSDPVSIEWVDDEQVNRTLERLEEIYKQTHTVAQIEKHQTINGQSVKKYVVVPVKPLFAGDGEGNQRRMRSPAE